MRSDERLAAPDDRGDGGLGGEVWTPLKVVQPLRGGHTRNGVIYMYIYRSIYLSIYMRCE